MRYVELNLDGLVGPLFSFGGLAFGNTACQANSMEISNPREAALQGLAKMRFLAQKGIPQAVLPPHERPAIQALRRLGFNGSDETVLQRAAHDCFPIFLRHCSASSMWAANAATVAPSVDTMDGLVHITPANLAAHFHRSLEAAFTSCILKEVFSDPRFFCHHSPLPTHPDFGDEGAANHSRFALSHGSRGYHLFVSGFSPHNQDEPKPKVYPGRQSLEASRAVARLNSLSEDQIVFAQQNPDAIDAGAFHNDVAAVGNESFLLVHELAWRQQESVLRILSARMGGKLRVLQVSSKELSLAVAVNSYVFNSQLVTLPSGGTVMLCPAEAREIPEANRVLCLLQETVESPLTIETFDLRQSMRNGGGPACLRLRIVLSEAELAAVHAGILLDEALHGHLLSWTQRHYRTTLCPQDLADPLLLRESREALDELTQIMNLGSIYSFQR
ncbi:MAG: N-succinylarginine dihydrolase [Acidobacteriota bacterium]